MNRIAATALLACLFYGTPALAHDDHDHAGEGVGRQTPAFKAVTLGSDTPAWFSAHLSADGGYAADGVYLLRGDGWDYYWAWDRGGFAYVEAEGDFTFSARIRGSMYLYQEAATGNAEKFGLVVREDLTTTSKMASLMWDRYWYDRLDGDTGVSWYWRHENGSLDDEKSIRPGHGLADNTVPDCPTMDDLYLQVTRDGDDIRFATRYGSEGEWRSVETVSRDGAAVQPKLSAGRLYIGFGLSTGGGSMHKRNPMQVGFDSIQLLRGAAGDDGERE